MTRLFISRKLNANSKFFELEKKGIELIHYSLLDIKPSEFKIEKSYGWVFFYSKNGIHNFFKKEAYSKDLKYAVMGTSSSSTFSSVCNESPDFIGTGSPEKIASEFNEVLDDKPLLFAKAKNSLNSIESILIEKYGKQSDSVIVYENSVKKEFDIPNVDVLVFTSPMNVEAYFSKYPYRSEVLFAIGPSTAKHIRTMTGQEAKQPSNASEETLYYLIANEMVL